MRLVSFAPAYIIETSRGPIIPKYKIVLIIYTIIIIKELYIVIRLGAEILGRQIAWSPISQSITIHINCSCIYPIY